MATQKEKGHGSDAPPKLQQLPGRSSHKLQGRLYSNAGRGYDREALQKMSAKAGPALVEPRTRPDGSVEKDSDEYHDNDVATSSLDTNRATQQHKNIYSTQHYLLGAILFLAGIVVGNVVIPALTTTTDKVVATKQSPADDEVSRITPISDGAESKEGCGIGSLQNGENAAGCSANNPTTTASAPANNGIDSITTITPNAATSTSGEAGCSVNSLNNNSNDSKGCSIEALSTTDNKKEAL